MSIRNLLEGTSSSKPWCNLIVNDIQTNNITVTNGPTGSTGSTSAIFGNLTVTNGFTGNVANVNNLTVTNGFTGNVANVNNLTVTNGLTGNVADVNYLTVNQSLSLSGDPQSNSFYGLTTEPNKLIYSVQGTTNSHLFVNEGPTGLFQINGNGVIQTNPDSVTSNILDDGTGKITCNDQLQIKGNGLLLIGTTPNLLTITSSTFTVPLQYNFYNAGDSCDVLMGIKNTRIISTSGQVITQDESGKLIFINNTTGSGYGITMPSVKLGLQYKIIVQQSLVGVIDEIFLEFPANTLNINIVDQAGSGVNSQSKTFLNFAAAFPSATGDQIEIFSDGINYFVSGIVLASTSMTFS